MGIYSRALRYIDMNRVKKLREEKIKQKKFAEEIREQIREELRNLNSPEFSNWRCELEEGMTSSGMFQTTLPATGDVNLAYPGWDIIDGQGYSVSDGTLTIGDGQVDDGAIATFDSSYYDTLIFDVSISGSSIFGVFSTEYDDPFLVSENPGTYSINVTQLSNLSLLFLASGLTGSVSISNLRFQRRTPITVFVSLDSPEATSFIRTDPSFANLSPEEKKKKLQDMLEASDEYIEKIFGEGFPGTGLDPAVGEAGDTPGVDTIDYGTDLTPLSDNPYGTEVSQDAAIYQRPDGSYYSVPGSVPPPPDTRNWPSIKDPVPPIRWPTPGVYHGGQGKA